MLLFVLPLFIEVLVNFESYGLFALISIKLNSLTTNFLLRYIVAGMAFLFFSCNGDVCEKIPAEIFFKNSESSLFQISPDGKYVSSLKENQNGEKNLFVQNILDGKHAQLTSFEGKSIRDYCWVGDNFLCLVVEDAGCKDFGMYTVQRDGNKLEEVVLSYSVTKIDFIQKSNSPDNTSVLFAMNDRDPERTDVYRLNVSTGKKEVIVNNPGHVLEWFADDNNVVRLARGSEHKNENWYYRETDKEDFKKIISNHFITNIKPISFVKGKKHHLYALSNIDRDKYALVEIDCSTGKEIRKIYENPDTDILDVVFSPKDNRVIYFSTGLEKEKRQFLFPGTETYYKNLNKKLKAEVIDIIDHDESEKNIILKAYSDKMPGSYYVYKSQENKLIKLGDVNDQIVPAMMNSMVPISYKNKEGIQIHGYLTLPKGGQQLPPLIVMPHSGPYKRTNWEYNPEVQFFASRGYAVFQPNFRGSTGYGKEFFSKGLKQWNSNIHADIRDGVDWLIANKKVDSSRVVAFGKGFGGFAALNLAIHQPKVYKCVVSYSGIMNLFTYIKSTPDYYKPHKPVIEELIGSPERDIDYIKSASPIFNSKKLNIPLLFFQGGKDSRGNLNEVTQFIKELKKHNHNVEYIVRDEEGQRISKFENKIHFYNAVDAFFTRYLK